MMMSQIVFWLLTRLPGSVFVDEVHIPALGNRDGRFVAVEVLDELFLQGEVHSLVLRESLLDGLGDSLHKTIGGILAGDERDPVAGELFREGAVFVGRHDVALLIQIGGNLSDG